MGLIDKQAYAEAEEAIITTNAKMEPGIYTCRVQKVVTEWKNSRGEARGVQASMCVMLVLDVDEGEFAGKYSSEFYEDASQDKKHAIYLSFKPTALGFFKRNCKCIDSMNHGFDSCAAIDAEMWTMLIGKRVRVLFDGREYDFNGNQGVSVRPSRLLAADETVEPIVELLDGSKQPWNEYTAQPALSTEMGSEYAYSNDEIPF